MHRKAIFSAPSNLLSNLKSKYNFFKRNEEKGYIKDILM